MITLYFTNPQPRHCKVLVAVYLFAMTALKSDSVAGPPKAPEPARCGAVLVFAC